MNLTADLADTVFNGKTALVLSDAFPPYAHGGAEISLSAVIDELNEAQRRRILVLSFSQDVSELTVSEHNGVTVLHAPTVAAWPHADLSVDDLANSAWQRRMRPTLYSRLVRLKILLRSRDRKSVLDAYREARLAPGGGIMIDHFLDEYDLRARLVSEVYDRVGGLEVLLCDNTRSILLGARLIASGRHAPRKIAVVRDNRFHCARPSQNRMVDGKFCETCQFQCASEDVRADGIELRKKTLARTAAFRQEALAKYDRTIVTSHELARHVLPLLKDTAQIDRIPNGIGDREFIEQSVLAMAQKPKPELMIIGMLNENKGQLEFLKKCVPWLRSNPDILIKICGRGERIEQAILKFVRGKKLEDQVRLIGFRKRDQVFAEMRCATLVIAPTCWPEPFGRVPLEAGAARRAIVAFGVGGLNESIIHGKTGFLAAPGDYKAFTDHIDFLLDHPEERLKMEAAAHAWVNAEYGPEKTSRVFAETVFGNESIREVAELNA